MQADLTRERIGIWKHNVEAFLPPWMCIPMSTAIARLLTPEGIVIAADCQPFDRSRGTRLSDRAHKIFPDANGKLACTVAGTTEIFKGDSSNILFDFIPEIKRAMDSMPSNLNTIYQCAGSLAEILDRSLTRARRTAGIDEVMDWPESAATESKTLVTVDGYCRGEAGRQDIWLFHDRPPQSRLAVLSSVNWYGSTALANVLFDKNDPRLADFKLPTEDPITLHDAIRIAKRYVLAYSDREAQAVDAAIDATKDRLLVATITRADGFRWLGGFEPF